jgi:hypothetical protein
MNAPLLELSLALAYTETTQPPDIWRCVVVVSARSAPGEWQRAEPFTEP